MFLGCRSRRRTALLSLLWLHTGRASSHARAPTCNLQATTPREPASRVTVQSRRALVVHERHEREVQRVLIVGGAVDHALGHLGNGATLLLAVGVSEDRIIRVAQPAAHAEASVR